MPPHIVRRSGVGRPPFQPVDVPNLVAWYRADSLSLNDGDPVASWVDSSGTGNTVTQATSGKKPTFKTNIRNGLPVLRFAGGQKLTGPASSISAPYSIFVAGNPTSTAVLPNQVVVYSADYSVSNGGLYIHETDEPLCVFAGADVEATDLGAVTGAWHAMLGIIDGASGLVQKDSATHPGTTGSNALAQIAIGATNDGATDVFFYSGDIGEVVMVSRHCTSTEISNVMAYLKARWATP